MPTSPIAYPGSKWSTSRTPPLPRSPVASTAGPSRWLAIAGTHAYVADGFPSGLQVVDISNPASPAIVGSVSFSDAAMGVAVAGTHAYVAAHSSGLQVVDISNPASPVIVGGVDTPGAAFGVAVAGNHAYVADWTSGLQAVDISNPASPVIVGSLDIPGAAYGLAVAGTHAYVAEPAVGLEVVDISNPSSPAVVGSGGTPAAGYRVAVAGTHAYVAAGLRGLVILPSQCGEPTAVQLSTPHSAPHRLAQNRPNPFQGDFGTTAIGFELAHRSRATLRVFDTSGRLIRLLLDETLEPGQHEAFWDGRDGRGKAVASGIYFYRLNAGEFVQRHPLVRVR